MNLLEGYKTRFSLAVLTFVVVFLGVLNVVGSFPESVFAQQDFDVGGGGSSKGTEFKEPQDVDEGDTFNYKFMVPIPQPEAGGGAVKEVGGETGIADYINILYLFGLGIGGVLAFVALVYGGFLWTVSGAVGKKSQAKSIIGNALLGLAILATSYIILHTVNPDLVGPLKAEKKSHSITQSGEACEVFSKESKEKAAQCCQAIKSTGNCGNYVLSGAGTSLGSWMVACRNDACDVCGEEDSLEGLVGHESSGKCEVQLSPAGGWECAAASDPICPGGVDKKTSVPNLVHEEGVNGGGPEPGLCEGKDCTDESGKDCTIDYCNSSTGECEHFDTCGGYAESCVCARVGKDGDLDLLTGDWGCVNCEVEFVTDLGGYDSEAGSEFLQCTNVECTGGDSASYCNFSAANQGKPCEQYNCDDCNPNCYQCVGTKCEPVEDAECGVKGEECGDGEKCVDCECCKKENQQCSNSGECCSGFCGVDQDGDGFFVESSGGGGKCMDKPLELDCSDSLNSSTNKYQYPGQTWYRDLDDDGCWSEQKVQCWEPSDFWYPSESSKIDKNCKEEELSCEEQGGTKYVVYNNQKWSVNKCPDYEKMAPNNVVENLRRAKIACEKDICGVSSAKTCRVNGPNINWGSCGPSN